MSPSPTDIFTVPTLPDSGSPTPLATTQSPGDTTSAVPPGSNGGSGGSTGSGSGTGGTGGGGGTTGGSTGGGSTGTGSNGGTGIGTTGIGTGTGIGGTGGGGTTTGGTGPQTGQQSQPGTGSNTPSAPASLPAGSSPLAEPGPVDGLSSTMLLGAVVGIGIIGVLLSLLITRRRAR